MQKSLKFPTTGNLIGGALQKFQLGAQIGAGAHGKVYPLISNKDRCIKIATINAYSFNTIAEFNLRASKLKEAILYIEKYKVKPFANIYESEFEKKRDLYLTFGYVMDRYYNITMDEYKLFHSLVSHEDRNKVKDISVKAITSRVHGMSLGLDFDTRRVIMFCDQLRDSNVKHLDLHPRNIMKDRLGNFKLIDLDNLLLEK